MSAHLGLALDEARDVVGLSDEELWQRYSHLGGTRDPQGVRAILSGDNEPSEVDADLLAHVLNERLYVELGGEADVPYPDERQPAVPQRGSPLIIDLRSGVTSDQVGQEFLSRIGHELRTPLTGMMGFAALIADPRSTIEGARASAEAILESGTRLKRIVELLEFSAAAATERLRITRWPVDLGAVIEGVVANWQRRLSPATEMELHLHDELPLITGDSAWIARAVNELIDNAVKFMPEGGTIIVGVAPVLEGRPAVAITVNDAGIGMPSTEVVPFAAFHQGDTSDTRSFGGLGLGLALVREVARAHGGSASLRANDAGGVCASLVVPVAVDPS